MSTLDRTIFAIRAGLKHRAELRDIHKNHATKLADIDFEDLKAQGCKAIIFDYDGILASHGKPKPDEHGVALLKKAESLFDSVYILSNKPNDERKTYFEKNFPNIHFIIGKRKKPYPDGINAILTDSKLQNNQVCIIDDRLTTGCLAAVLANIPALYVTNPTKDYGFAPLPEMFFDLVRAVERVLF